MLVLRISHDKDGKPLTIKRMREIFDEGDALGDPKKKSKIFYSKRGEGWYNNQEFATESTPKLGWGLVMKEVLPESLNKNRYEQKTILKEWAEKNKIDPATVKHRTPVEVAYDQFTYYGKNQESLLEKTYDCTSVWSFGWVVVNVGRFQPDGPNVFSNDPGGRNPTLGVCPAFA